MVICKGRDSEQKNDEAVHGGQCVSQLIFQAPICADGRLLCIMYARPLGAKPTYCTAHALWIYTRGHEYIDGIVA
jgi:hypothetical protein